MSQSEQDDRKETLKNLILELHEGGNVDEIRDRFRDLVGDVSAVEISQMEQQLISEGLPAEDVRALCDVHVSIFQEGLGTAEQPEMTPGHPIHTFKYENFALNEMLDLIAETIEELPGQQAWRRLDTFSEQMMQFNRIYVRKENLLFPFLEKHGVSGPTSVMWGIHDEIREQAKEFQAALEARDVDEIKDTFNKLAEDIRAMFYKEENILYPTALKMLSEAEWLAISDQSDEIGYCLIRPGDKWDPDVPEEDRLTLGERFSYGPDQGIELQVGVLTPKQIDVLLRHLPVDVTYVDETDTVRYYSETVHGRAFTRTPSVIGRKVQNCHPPKSLHIVNAILEGFRNGTRDSAEFWITFEGAFLHISYYAMRDAEGAYRGALEVTQDVTHIRELKGEKRLLDEPAND